jgi:serine/threonine protein phosphatase PrpC
MHPFQENIQTWISRRLASRSSSQCLDIPFVLSSDIGLVRKENQDRAAALYTGKKSINPLFAIAVADGMGGMRDGGKCSSLAISSFFYSLIQHRNLGIKERAYEAVKASNNQVFEIYRGDGGSTLTAVLLDSQGAKIIVHLGDTRVYTFGAGKKVERHTTDDSLVEAVGGSGRELLQFIGMGDSIQPKISEFSCQDGFCAITTDGIHGIEEKTLSRILENSSSLNEASERLNSVAMWCGGNDNSTSAIFDIAEMLPSLAQYQGSGIRLWDAGGDLTTLWLREEEPAFNAKHAQAPNEMNDAVNNYSSQLIPSKPPKIERASKKSKPPVRKSRKKKTENYPEEVQLDIEIGNSAEQGDVGADSK